MADGDTQRIVIYKTTHVRIFTPRLLLPIAIAPVDTWAYTVRFYWRAITTSLS